MSINANAPMNSPMDCDDVNEYTAAVDNNIACDGCTKEVTVSDCNNNRRGRRSATLNAVINLQFTIALNESDNLGLVAFAENQTGTCTTH